MLQAKPIPETTPSITSIRRALPNLGRSIPRKPKSCLPVVKESLPPKTKVSRCRPPLLSVAASAHLIPVSKDGQRVEVRDDCVCLLDMTGEKGNI
ncbi:hypothetical protein CDAR_126491 [Caerostris darwini]|uniref:Uncharacterized protein n=1 Tax=Caerostris darwini TaxID=1538125 RepID=A0AAV4R6U8_9ARAC|nr:hypothetical protein CDAR_126491 [Caerostris darwini]